MTRHYRGKPDLPPGPARDIVALFTRLRATRQLTVGQIAVKSKLATSHVSEVLRGWKAPSPRAAEAIAVALGADSATALRARRLAEDLAELNRYQRARAARPAAANSAAGSPRDTAHGPGGTAGGHPGAVWLRRRLADFHGREAEVARVTRMLRDRDAAPAVVILYGMGGIGKTTVANEVAHRLSGDFTGARILVDLGGPGLPDELQAAQADAAFREAFYAFRVPEADIPRQRAQQAQLLQGLLARAPSLLVLDNVARAGQVADLLPTAPGCAALITSRSPLPALDGAYRVGIRPLPAPSGITLFRRLADREDPAAGAAADTAAIRRIVELAGGLPLAIRIAAAAASAPPLRDAPLADLAGLLATESGQLDGFEDGERGVRASFDISYRTLAPEAAAFFRVLGLLPVTEACLDLTAAAAAIPAAHALSLASTLAEAQLVDAVGPLGQRFRMHDLVRLYAREVAVAVHDRQFRATVLSRILDWYATAADQVMEPPSTAHHPSDAALAWFEQEHLNALSVAHAAFEAGDWQRLGRIGAGLRPLLWYGKRWDDLTVTEEWTVQAAARGGNWREEVNALMYLGESRRLTGQPRTVAALYERALAICRQEADPRATAWVTTHYGDSFLDLDDPEQAIARYEDALAVVRSAGAEDMELWLAAHFNDAYLRAGRTGDAVRAGESWLTLARRRNDEENEVWVGWHLALAYREAGRLEEALDLLRHAVDFHRRREDPGAVTHMLMLLGETQQAAGQTARGEASLREALRLARGIGIQPLIDQITASLPA
jgi:tetratricopeptide (TPR) repeat protein